jgi:protein SCO1/2
VQRDVRVVMITTDPGNDKPKVMGRWLRNLDVDLPVAFVGLTGTKAQVETAQRLAGVPVAEDEGKQHSTQLTLYGSDDVARVFYLTGDPPSDLSKDLPKIAAKE